MNEVELRVLKELHVHITSSLDANIVLGHFYAHGFLTETEVLHLREISYPSERTEKFIFLIKNRCSFQSFVDGLSVSGYDFLVEDIKAQFEGSRASDSNAADAANDKAPSVLPDMRKVSVFNKRWRHKSSYIAHGLTRLVHNGHYDKFMEYKNTLVERWYKNMENPTIDIETKFEYADQAFAALDTEISMKRIKYDKNLAMDPVFYQFENLIPYTSDPIVASMTFLARKSSAIVIGKPVTAGLERIKYAKVHSESVSPCRESGMVFYIEFNMLAQKYEHDGPTSQLKSKLIETAKASIGHFNDERNEDVRTDFKRMLLLKIANVHLGIGAFGNAIEAAEVSASDLRSAKKILDDLEEPEFWDRMEKRRKMFFHIAKSRLFYHRKQFDLAHTHALSAQKLSMQGDFKKELPYIEELLTSHSVECMDPDDSIRELDKLLSERDTDVH